MTKTFAKATWLRYIDSREDFSELLSLEVQDELLNQQQCPAHSVDVEMSAFVATNVGESRVNDVPDDKDNWNFEGAFGLDEVVRVGVKIKFLDLQESCRVKRRKVPGTVAEAVELANKLVNQVGEFGAQVANDTAPVALASVETKVVPLSDKLKKAREEAVSTKSEIDAPGAAGELDTNEQNVALENAREEGLDDVKMWKATTSQGEATLAKVHEETSVEMSKLWRECVAAAARQHKLLASILRVVKTCEERKDKVAGTLMKLRKTYDDGRMLTADALVAE